MQIFITFFTVKNSALSVFKCLVIGSAPIRVSWQKDGKRLIDSPANRISSNGNQHKLEMPKSALDDTGTITVVAENDFGKTNSSAYLHVQGTLNIWAIEFEFDYQKSFQS